MEALDLLINSEKLPGLSPCSLLAHVFTLFVQLCSAFSPQIMSAATVQNLHNEKSCCQRRWTQDDISSVPFSLCLPWLFYKSSSRKLAKHSLHSSWSYTHHDLSLLLILAAMEQPISTVLIFLSFQYRKPHPNFQLGMISGPCEVPTSAQELFRRMLLALGPNRARTCSNNWKMQIMRYKCLEMFPDTVIYSNRWSHQVDIALDVALVLIGALQAEWGLSYNDLPY